MTKSANDAIFKSSMRERTNKVDTDKLIFLGAVYRPSIVAKTLGISKQRWHNYVIGVNDMPDSVLEKLCKEYNLTEDQITLVV